MYSMLTLWLFHIVSTLMSTDYLDLDPDPRPTTHVFSILFQYGEHVARSNLKIAPQLKGYWVDTTCCYVTFEAKADLEPESMGHALSTTSRCGERLCQVI